MSEFSHLSIHTEYSVVDSVIRIPQLASCARERGLGALAITDVNNMFGMVKFQTECFEHGIKPIFGVELSMEGTEENGSRLVALAATDVGYRNLIKLVSSSYRNKGSFAHATYETLAELSQGLILLSGGCGGEVGRLLLRNRIDDAAKRILWYQKYFPDRFYCEVTRTGREDEEGYIRLVSEFADHKSIPLVATNDVCFLDLADYDIHALKVNASSKLSDLRGHSEHQYLRTADEMVELFKDLPDAVENANEIAKRCNVKIEIGKTHLPRIQLDPGETPEGVLVEDSWSGLESYLATLPVSKKLERDTTYRERLEHELQVINQMGFAAYFLIVREIMVWCRERDIAVGIRGSGNASLVSYVIGITNIDPLKYDLIFERLLNPERVSLPDFDIDICMLNRQRVMDHVTELYGEHAVAQVVSFNTFGARGVIRDVTRVLGLPYSKGSELVDLIPIGPNVSLDNSIANDPRIEELARQDPDINEILVRAKKLEGLVRNVTKHPAGAVIAPSELTDYVPYFTESPEGDAISHLDKQDVESVGLVKFDFLGLKTLTVIDQTLEQINSARAEESAISTDTIPLDDPETYRMISRGDTIGVFQLESQGMRTRILRLKPDCIDDLIALVALFRPGPLNAGNDRKYSERKHGDQEVEFDHPSLEPVLNKTYGLMLYQEDAMSVSRTLAGFSLGKADTLRHAMAKKQREKMAGLRKDFVDGAVDNDVDAENAEAIFNDMEGFAEYGFPKSHATAYAVVAMQTAWLKCHFPLEFMANTLTFDMQDVKRIPVLVRDAVSRGIRLLAPDVHSSKYAFSREGDSIRWGFGALKGIGEEHAEAIVLAREHGEFKSLFDFCCRVDKQKITKDVVLSLIRSGALDSLVTGAGNPKSVRAILEREVEATYQAAVQKDKADQSNQLDMFGGVQEDALPTFHSDEIEPWNFRRLVHEEIHTLGVSLSGHPVDEYVGEIKDVLKRPQRLRDLRQFADQDTEMVCRVVDAAEVSGRDGTFRLVGEVDDKTALVSFTVYESELEHCRQVLRPGEVVVMKANVREDEFGEIRLRCNGAMTIDAFRATRHATLRFRIAIEKKQEIEEFLDCLRSDLSYESGGEVPELEIHENGYTARLRLGESWRVVFNQELCDRLRTRIDDDAWEVWYP